MVFKKQQSKHEVSVNYLCKTGQKPQEKESQLYDFAVFQKKDVTYIEGNQSHARRRKQMLAKYPQIADLLVPDKPYTIIIACIVIIFCMTVTYLVKDSSWPVYLTVLYFVSGTAAHMLHVLIHDLTHSSGHKNKIVNQVFAILCNIPMGIPSAMPFAKYHSFHHNSLGQRDVDPDVPFQLQSKLSRYTAYKIFYWLSYSLFYAFRPLICCSRPLRVSQVINTCFIILTNYVVYKYWGVSALMYLIGVAYVSIGPHPAAIHGLAEHYEFATGVQTYDYIGIWNIFNLNVGYHVEHHDFPVCPWYNLPKIRKIAPQFYQYLPCHTSYTKLLMKFLFDKNFNLYNWVVRIPKDQ